MELSFNFGIPRDVSFTLSSKRPFIRSSFSTGTGTTNRNDFLSWDYWFGNGYSSSFAGVTVNSETALKLSAFWRGVNLLSSISASFPVGLYKRLPNGDTQEVTGHPAIRLLKMRPNKMMTSVVFREATQANTFLHGNGYAYIERNGTGVPLSFKLMDSTQTEPRTDGDIIVYRYGDKVINSYNILHIPGLSFDGISGKSVIKAGAESMGVGLAMQKYTGNFYKNGAKQSGFLMHPMALSDTAKSGMRKSFDEKVLGPEGGTGILDEGMKYIPNTVPPVDAQLLQSKQFSVQDIARWLGVPPYLLFEESRSTFTNIENQGLEFVRYTLTQWVLRWEAELNIKLLTTDEQDDHFFKLNMDSLVRGNLRERMEAYRIALEEGILNIDEVRAKEDLNSLPNGLGKKHLIQMNRIPIEDLAKNKEIK